jgi:hypothetical protein
MNCSTAIAGVFAILLVSCSAAQERACELNALRVLPLDDPDAISVGDTRELVKNLKSCRESVREFPGDAGR